MKKVIFLLTVVTFLASCGNGSNTEVKSVDSTSVSVDTIPAVDSTCVDSASCN
jgi:hypothetical protein